jgi:hypothetical protein
MRSNKRYSNVPITKRVDYDGGMHRGTKAPTEPRVCTECGNVYAKRRWMLPSDPRAPITAALAARVLCPACKAKADGVPRGYLTLSGDFLSQHRIEIETLLRRESERAAEDNPIGRILSLETGDPATITVTTSTEHLIERLGHAVTKAYGGTVDYGFSHGNKLARGTWRRD